MYKLKLSRREKRELIRAKWIILFAAIACIAAVIWLAWIRPAQREQGVDSFQACAAAGYPIQESYPEVCLTSSGKRFVNPVQHKAHQASLEGEEELVPPSNPNLLYLDINEWEVRVPLTMETFDLIYAYLENGTSEELTFSFKRLVKADFCESDVGLTLTRSTLKNEPPYYVDRPAPTVQVGNNYYYARFDDKPCYDVKNSSQVALIKEIAGDKNLTQLVLDLLAKLQAIPKL